MQTSKSPKKKKKRTKWIIGGVIVALVAAGGLFIASRVAGRNAQAEVQTGDIVAAFTGDLDASATASGKIEAEQVALLSASAPDLVEEVLVRDGHHVAAGDPLVQLDTSGLELQLAKAQQNLALKEANLESLLAGPDESDVASAEAAVASAQAQLDKLLEGPSEQDIAESEAAIRQQLAAVASASAAYGSTRDSISQSSIASAEAELVNAQIAYDQAKERNEDFAFSFTHDALVEAEENLAIAQAKVDELRAGAKQGSLNAASADISAASANVENARSNHEVLLAGTSEDQIAAAEASLAQAQLNLANLLDSAAEEDVIIAQAELEQARLALADAEESLAKATISAPFDGIVTAVFVADGERANGEVVELVSDELKVVLSVDEIDVGVLSPGQSAIITLETWPDEEISGDIVSIAPKSGSSGDGIVTYDVQINLDEPPDLPILVGMTANAKLITASKDSVVLVPNAAITADRDEGTYWVNLVTGQSEAGTTTEKVEVIIGLKDEDFTQIISGLSSGDEVLIGELAAPTLQFGPFGGG